MPTDLRFYPPYHTYQTLTLNRSTFFGGASASATSTPISIKNYDSFHLYLTTSSPMTNSASGAVSVTYNPEWSADGGTTWVPIPELNGARVPHFIHYPVASTPVERLHAFPGDAPNFRVRISDAGASASGASALCIVGLAD